MAVSYQCSICGELHEGFPDLGFRWPDPYFGVPEEERDRRIRSTVDVCVIDGEQFFIRGVILMPIRDSQAHFGLGAWVSQERENFERYLEKFDTASLDPTFGWLCNRITFYEEDTWALKTMVHFQGNGQRPRIEIEPSDHRLSTDYSSGITLDRAWELIHVSGG